MRFLTSVLCGLICLAAAVAQAQQQAVEVPRALHDFVSRNDGGFGWKLIDKQDAGGAITYEVDLTSQIWQDITWKHDLLVFQPARLTHPDHVLMYIGGGSNKGKPKADDRVLGATLAALSGTRVAILFQVPNQPLLGGRFEDDLITDTFLFHLATKDDRWPLLFPMVKSAVRAMDCIEQLGKQEWKTDVKGFVVSGASKRGWTTWLTGAVDGRVQGIAPIVIDTLNMPRQMDYQVETWGKYSEQIDDYERKGLIKRLKDDAEIEPLWRWVDPYTYRHQLTLPKLIINGTNDRYWTVDALNNYWDDLVGTKYIRYVPNAGHNLKGGREGALATLSAFTQHVAAGKPFPVIEWKHDTDNGHLRLTIHSKVRPMAVKLWTAESESKDFRESEWKSEPLKAVDDRYVGEIPAPVGKHAALFGELEFTFDNLNYSLSTQLRRE
ncbi:MAG: phenylacetic acid degradation protein [Planctomycetes bacterium]|nr:phenylacetic acid degradation protein [Planctomycetota bacterium]